MNNFFLFLVTFWTLLSGILVITSKNPVIAIIFLISVFISAAIYLIKLGIIFVGLSYIIVYIGAITVLFLFIIMMINIRLVDILELGSEYTKNLPLAVFLGVLFIFEIFTILPFTLNNVLYINIYLNIINYFNNLLLIISNIFTFLDIGFVIDMISLNLNYFSGLINYSFYYMDIFILNFLQVEVLALSLYTYGSSWLLLCSIILLLAMLSAIFLSSNSNNNLV